MMMNRRVHSTRVRVFMMALFLFESLSRTISIYTCPRSRETFGMVKPITIASDKATNSYTPKMGRPPARRTTSATVKSIMNVSAAPPM
jgi:hypothetical protein